MRIEIITVFPEYFASPLRASMVARAAGKGLVEYVVHDLRDHATGRHRSVDDTPYGGGGGMVFRPEPVFRAWQALELGQAHCVYLTADGAAFTQDTAVRLSRLPRLALLCGHYKGIDERIRTRLIDEEISIGDYVLTGGEPAACVVLDAVVRLIPGVLGDFGSALEDSFQDWLLDCPWYTRPAQFDGQTVPQVLRDGDHRQVRAWRRRQALQRTFERRPELLDRAPLDEDEERLVADWRRTAARAPLPAGNANNLTGTE
jgi:tRNA (guanine37-N1)-methyltransferase